MHKQPDDIWRIDYQLRDGQSTEEALQPAAVQRVRAAAISMPSARATCPGGTVWTSVYRAGAMTLERYRHGRVLFAGNAAHAMPIFGVRGLNSGFDDADNLAWKLALVARGVSDASLLDSYSQERIAAFHVNAENAMRSTEFMSPPSRGFDLLREAALSLAGAHRGIANLINPRQTQAVGYADSMLSSPGDELAQGPRPGEALPEQALADGSHLTDRVGAAFTVLLLNLPQPDAAVNAEVAQAQAGPLPVALCALSVAGRRPEGLRSARRGARRRLSAAPRRPRGGALAPAAPGRAAPGPGAGGRTEPQGARMRPPCHPRRAIASTPNAQVPSARPAPSGNRCSSPGSRCCCSNRSATRRAAARRSRKRSTACRRHRSPPERLHLKT